MPVEFHGSNQATIGVEIELQIIDPVTKDLTPRAQEVLALCEKRDICHVKAEIHQSMLEVDTKISADIKGCRESLEETLSGLYSVVEELGLQLSVSGTHPFQKWPERQIFPSARYLGLHKKFRWLVKRMNVYGLHVHIGIPDAEKAISLTRALIRYLPHLLALSANSPFWHGEDTGMQACRPNILESFTTGGLPPYLESWKDYELYFETLSHARAVFSPKDFYWYVRPNPIFGTIEFRICDAVSSLHEILAIVSLIQNLVEWVNRDQSLCEWDIKQHWIIPENLLIAARDGLNGVIMKDLSGSRTQIAGELFELIEQLTPIAYSLNNYDEFLYLKTILKKGNGALRQLRAFKETGSLGDVVQMSSEEFALSLNSKNLVNVL